MAHLLIISADGKQRMLLNTDLVFAFVEEGEKVNAVSHNGAVIEVPQTLDEIASVLEEIAHGEKD